MAEIPIYGTLVNATTDPKIVNTDQAWDKKLGKYQAEINKERLESSDNMEQELQDLTSKLDSEIQDRTQGDTALGKRIDKEIQDRKDADTALDQKLSQAIKEEADARAEYDDNMMVKFGEEEDARKAEDTALKTSIDDLAAKHEAFVATKGKANGLAPLDESGLVPASHLPSYVDDVIEVYATYDVNPTGGLTNIKLYTDAGHQTPITGESGKIYINVANGEPSYQFRWSGTKFVDSNTSSLIIGEIAGTAFEGSRGKALETYVNNHFLNNVGSPISKRWFISSSTTGNSMVEITPNINGQNLNISLSRASLDSSGKYQDGVESNVIPAATKTAAGVMTASDRVKLDETLPNAIAAEEAARIAKDNAHDKLINSLPLEIMTVINDITPNTERLLLKYFRWVKNTEEGSYDKGTDVGVNIPAATKTAAGVMTASDKTNLDNTVQGLANEITDRTNAINSLRTELKTYVDGLIADTGSDVTTLETKVNNHLANKSNPHSVTKAQVGLGNASNTSDADKPVSTAQAAAIADAKAAGTAAQTSINSHAGRKDNPHTVTRAQLGLATTDQVVFAKTTAPSGFWKESSDIRSDIRLKDNIRDLNHTLDQICQIPTKSFTMLGKEDEGTIAQNLEGLGFGKYVEEVPVEKSTVPNPEEFETLEINGEEYVLVKQVKYHKMSTLAIEGVKLLYDEIKALKAEIQELKNK